MGRRIFIDGASGTAGIEIRRLIAVHPQFEVMEIDESIRRDPDARAARMNAADAVVLCLPAKAAAEAVARIRNPDVKLVDCSARHRQSAGWIYGLPELGDRQREEIAASKRVANPGCFATAFILGVRPLLAAERISPETAFACFGTTGYSAGGSPMIRRYEKAAGTRASAESKDSPMTASVPPAVEYTYLNLEHRHIPEMRTHAGLVREPVFIPTVGAFRRGLLTVMPLDLAGIAGTPSHAELSDFYCSRYAAERFVHIADSGTMHVNPEQTSFNNRVEIELSGKGRDCVIRTRLDNLGKGSAGAAIQNLNLMFGLSEDLGLIG